MSRRRALCFEATKTIASSDMASIRAGLRLERHLNLDGFADLLSRRALLGAIFDWNREKRQTTLSCLLLILLPTSIEGSSPRLSCNREERVQASEVVAAAERDVHVARSHSLQTNMPLPIYLRMNQGSARVTPSWEVGMVFAPDATGSDSTTLSHCDHGSGQPGRGPDHASRVRCLASVAAFFPGEHQRSPVSAVPFISLFSSQFTTRPCSFSLR